MRWAWRSLGPARAEKITEQKYQADNELGRQYKCQLPPELPKRWPLGIDRIKELWDSNADGRLLAFLCSIAKDYEPGNNLYQFLLVGPLLGKGIFTQEGPAVSTYACSLSLCFLGPSSQRTDCHIWQGSASKTVFYSLRAAVDQEAANQEFAECFNIAQEGLAKRFRLAPFHYFYNPPKFRRACRKVHEFVESYIRDRENSRFLDTADQSTWFLDKILLNVLLAGRDTTACCLSWAFRLLVRHPHHMQRLRSEVKAVMGDSLNATREQIRNMPFLASLRLYPPLPQNNREAVRTTILPTGGGPDGNSPILVQKGEVVMFSQYVNSRKKNIYGIDADIFRQERWETGELANIGWAYFPFNGGPRRCLGEDFALMEVYCTTIKLLQTFPCIELPPDEPNEPVGMERQRLSLVLASAHGCKISTSKAS
ncbi:cytochrome P450 [Xylaria castorea]|nr:cytochrome P450 [Xylaria castorea]